MLGVVRSGDFYPGHLLRGRTVFMHMTHRIHGINTGDTPARGRIPRGLGAVGAEHPRRSANSLALTARLTRQRDQSHRALARGNRRCRMFNMG